MNKKKGHLLPLAPTNVWVTLFKTFLSSFFFNGFVPTNKLLSETFKVQPSLGLLLTSTAENNPIHYKRGDVNLFSVFHNLVSSNQISKQSFIYSYNKKELTKIKYFNGSNSLSFSRDLQTLPLYLLLLNFFTSHLYYMFTSFNTYHHNYPLFYLDKLYLPYLHFPLVVYLNLLRGQSKSTKPFFILVLREKVL